MSNGNIHHKLSKFNTGIAYIKDHYNDKLSVLVEIIQEETKLSKRELVIKIAQKQKTSLQAVYNTYPIKENS